MFYILISILSGSIVVTSRILNTKLSEKVGLMQSSFFNYLTGLSASLILIVFLRDKFLTNQFNTLPFYAYLGGLLGVIVVILSSVITPKMSSFYATLIIFIGQLFAGIVIDFLINQTISFTKIVGGLLVISGLAYNLYIDYISEEIKNKPKEITT
ncbi:EamA family transporter [Clostridium chromiireducens]|uniref:EamA family transporter n=1 Tax=Clostridium chromiireducens TaxID=225345 RepID=A0A964RQM1_9CLOT|nr:DMT family transporter [Clostridium chromiireducens]MVX66026.1 EamA family transporter [Clostridium chromiireducens]